jgi:hypothetical protein
MNEIVVNTHMHTTYSDGRACHRDIAYTAIKAGLDAIIVTDHNVLVSGLEGYYGNDDERVLVLVGEEIHDQGLYPQKNHLLVFGVDQELAPLAWDRQRLLDNIRLANGYAYIAHPDDPSAPLFGEDAISWDDWDVQGYTGIELWNAMSEFKSLLTSKFRAIYFALNPKQVARGPFLQTLRRWDELLISGQRVVAIGGSDAHALKGKLGPIERVLFPYLFHFQGINNHLLLEEELQGDLTHDRHMILEALAMGSGFIGYDLPRSTRGFRFSAHGLDGKVIMGGELALKTGVTLQIRLPIATECRLIKDGEQAQVWNGRETCTYITTQPGVFRVEAYINFMGRSRGWIFSNPIFIV